METRHAAGRRVNVVPLVVITLTNYAAQVPYYLHNDYSSQHVLPGVRAIALMAGTLAFFGLGLTGYRRRLSWGPAVLLSFLAIEALFYAGTFATGEFIFQLENPSYLLKAVFVIGYASGAVAAYYAYRLCRELRPRPSRAQTDNA